MDTSERRMVQSVDRERLISRLQRLLSYPSFSATDGEKALAQWVASAANESLGVCAELSATPEGRPSVLLKVGGADGHYGLMLNGHIDTNMVSLGWTRDPFGGECDEEFIYGIGVSNMKAAVAAMWEAVTTVATAGVQLEAGLVAAFVCGELQGGVGTKHLIETGLRSDAFIVGEPTDLAVLTRHAGAFSVDVEVRGEMRHMSKAEEGVNAVLLGGLVLKAFEDAHGTSAGSDGLTRINVGAIRGGTGPEMQDWRSSMVPDRCVARVACRIEPGDTPVRFVAHLQEIAELATAGKGGQVEVTMADQGQRLVMGPFDVPQTDPFVSLVATCYEDVTGKAPIIGEVAPYKYYGTDGSHLRDAGMVGVVCGPGGKYNTMPDERVELADIVAAAKLYTLAALRSCAPKRR